MGEDVDVGRIELSRKDKLGDESILFWSLSSLIVSKELFELSIGPVAILSLLVLNLVEEATEWQSLVDIGNFHDFHLGESALLGLLPDLLRQEGLIHLSISVHVHTLVDLEQPLENAALVDPLGNYGGTFYAAA